MFTSLGKSGLTYQILIKLPEPQYAGMPFSYPYCLIASSSKSDNISSCFKCLSSTKSLVSVFSSSHIITFKTEYYKLQRYSILMLTIWQIGWLMVARVFKINIENPVKSENQNHTNNGGCKMPILDKIFFQILKGGQKFYFSRYWVFGERGVNH